MNGKYFKL